MLKSRKVLSEHIFESFPREKTKKEALFLLKTRKNKINPNRRIELESEEELKRGEVVYLLWSSVLEQDEELKATSSPRPQTTISVNVREPRNDVKDSSKH